eukprot:855454-Ditylum_brightwellii.AAC.1
MTYCPLSKRESIGRDMELTQQNKSNLSLAWIDYQKAYDLVPHSWILEVLEIYKDKSTLYQFIEKLIPLWRTKLNLHTDDDTITTKELNGDKYAILTIVNGKPLETTILDYFP